MATTERARPSFAISSAVQPPAELPATCAVSTSIASRTPERIVAYPMGV